MNIPKNTKNLKNGDIYSYNWELKIFYKKTFFQKLKHKIYLLTKKIC